MFEVTICLSFMDQIVNQGTFYFIYHKAFLKVTFLSKNFPWYGVTHGLLPRVYPMVANYNHLLTITSIFLKNGQENWSTMVYRRTEHQPILLS